MIFFIIARILDLNPSVKAKRGNKRFLCLEITGIYLI